MKNFKKMILAVLVIAVSITSVISQNETQYSDLKSRWEAQQESANDITSKKGDVTTKAMPGSCTGTELVTQPSNIPSNTVQNGRAFSTTFGSVMDDFIVPIGEVWTIEELTTTIATFDDPPSAGMTITFRMDDAGTPGADIVAIIVPSSDISYTDTGHRAFDALWHLAAISLPSEVILSEGTYWIEFSTEETNDTFIEWINAGTPTGSGYYTDYGILEPRNADLAFFLCGSTEAAIPTVGQWGLLVLGLIIMSLALSYMISNNRRPQKVKI